MEIFSNQAKGILYFARARNRVSALLLLMLPAASLAASLTFSQASANLQSSDISRRYHAIEALRNFQTHGAASLLANALTTEKDLHLQAAILKSLTTLRDPSTAPAIALILNSQNAFIRQRAAYAMGFVGGPTAEKALDTALPGEKDTYVRSTELMALSICGTAQSVSVIQAALADPKTEVRAQAIQALRHIPGNASLKALNGDSESDPNLKNRIQEAIQEKVNGAQ